MDKEKKFYRNSITNYDVITKAGKWVLVCANNVTDKHLVSDADGSNLRYIVNFKAIAADKVKAVTALFMDNNEVDLKQVDGLFLTHSIPVEEGADEILLPLFGERVECIVAEKPLRDGSMGLRIISANYRPAKKPSKFDMSVFAEPREEVANAELPATTEAVNDGVSLEHAGK